MYTVKKFMQGWRQWAVSWCVAIVLMASVSCTPPHVDSPARIITGPVVKIEELNTYYVKDETRGEVRITIDQTTKAERMPRLGEIIEAHVPASDRATAVTIIRPLYKE